MSDSYNETEIKELHGKGHIIGIRDQKLSELVKEDGLKSFHKWNVKSTKKESAIGNGEKKPGSHKASDHAFEKISKVSEHIYKITQKQANSFNEQAHNTGIMYVETETKTTETETAETEA